MIYQRQTVYHDWKVGYKFTNTRQERVTNMKIVVLERIEMAKEQIYRLEQLGELEWFDSSNEEECKKRIKGTDVVVVNWIDPSPFILSMKSPSLLSLMSTGYGW